jgi:hypothetical protein
MSNPTTARLAILAAVCAACALLAYAVVHRISHALWGVMD